MTPRIEQRAMNFSAKIAALESRIRRLTEPTIYEGAYYATAQVPDTCPVCDSRSFISYGVKGMICKDCWLTAELDKAERQLEERDARIKRLEAPVSIADFKKEGIQGLCAVSAAAALDRIVSRRRASAKPEGTK